MFVIVYCPVRHRRPFIRQSSRDRNDWLCKHTSSTTRRTKHWCRCLWYDQRLVGSQRSASLSSGEILQPRRSTSLVTQMPSLGVPNSFLTPEFSHTTRRISSSNGWPSKLRDRCLWDEVPPDCRCDVRPYIFDNIFRTTGQTQIKQAETMPTVGSPEVHMKTLPTEYVISVLLRRTWR